MRSSDETAATADGRTLWIDESDGFALRFEDESAAIPGRDSGIAEFRIVLTPDESRAVTWMCSGQSQIGYEVYELGPLRHVLSVPYRFGEGNPPVFSSDGSLLAMAWATNPGLRGWGDQYEELESFAKESIVEWGGVEVRDFSKGGVSTCRLDVRAPAGFPADGEIAWWPSKLEVSREHVRFVPEWGEPVEIALPLPESIVITAPKTP